MRFAGGIEERRLALRQDGGHQDVLGAGNRHQVHHQAGAPEPLGARADIAVGDVDLRPKRLQPLDMQVHRSGTDRAAPWQ